MSSEEISAEPLGVARKRQPGNCLVYCKQCLIHPAGPSLSKLQISIAADQQMMEDRTSLDTEANRQLELSQTILEIQECGEEHVLVKTSQNITLVRVETEQTDLACRLRICTKVPCSSDLSNLTLHPRYCESDATEPLIAATSLNSRNTIHVGSFQHLKSFEISNLKTVDSLQFTPSHPRVLYSTALSYARPALVPHFTSVRAILSQGRALYSIDLRSSKATFQWSPSGHGCVVEGLYSVDEVMTDWNQPNRLIVSSTQQQSVWELDSRMPYRCVHTWSLPSNQSGKTFLQRPRGDGKDTPFIVAQQASLAVFRRPGNPTFFGTQNLEPRNRLVFGASSGPYQSTTWGVASSQTKESLQIFAIKSDGELHHSTVRMDDGTVTSSNYTLLRDIPSTITGGDKSTFVEDTSGGYVHQVPCFLDTRIEVTAFTSTPKSLLKERCALDDGGKEALACLDNEQFTNFKVEQRPQPQPSNRRRPPNQDLAALGEQLWDDLADGNSDDDDEYASDSDATVGGMSV